MKPQAQSKGRSDLPYRVEQLTYELLALASRHFGTELPTPQVRFDLRGTSAGQARITDKVTA